MVAHNLHGLGTVSREKSSCDVASPPQGGTTCAAVASTVSGNAGLTVGSGSKSRSRLSMSPRGLSSRCSAITPPKYNAKNRRETETILKNAPGAPDVVAKSGLALMNRAVATPAPTDAAKNFQITANTGPIPSPIGFPAYQKPGNIRRKYEIVQANAIPEGPHRKVNKNRLAVQTNSIKPQRSHLSGRPIER